MRSNTVFTMIAILLALTCLGCSTSNVGTLADPVRDSSRFTLDVDSQSFIDGSSAEEIYLTTEESDPYHVLVNVNARGAVGMKALYFKMDYDPDALRPMTVEPTDAMGPRGDMLRIQYKKDRGTLHYGQIITNPQWRTGASGDVTLATVSFRKEATPAWRTVSTPPNVAGSAAILEFDGVDQLDWRFASIGDYNQDGLVGVSDITPLGVNFLTQSPDFPDPWPYEHAFSVVDGDSNGEISVSDLTPIGVHFNKSIFGGYNVYGSTVPADYPADAGDDNGGATLLGNLTIADDATGDPVADRLMFNFTVTAPQVGEVYWVRPNDGTDDGQPSNLVGSSPDQPVLALTNPPGTGSGTAGDPYVANVTTDYIFTLTDPVDGDVSNDAGTIYNVSNGAGTIDTADATLNIEDAFTGNFNVTASYNGTPNRSDTTVFMTVGPGPSGDVWIMPDDMGSPPWSDVPQGDGSSGDPYVVRSDTFNDDYSATFGLAANTQEDGMGDDIDVETLTWDAFPPFIVEDPSWAAKGEFMANSDGFTNGYIFAEDAESNMSNDLYIVSVGVLP